MQNRFRRSVGFMLVNLMVVISIIGILMAIAIPNFLRFQLRSKAGEARHVIQRIMGAEEEYKSEFGVYLPAAIVPEGLPNDKKRGWVSKPSDGFTLLGFSPEGGLAYCQYGVNITADGQGYTVGAQCDIDDDGEHMRWGYIKPSPLTHEVALHPFGGCMQTGIYNNNTRERDLLETVGPCGPDDLRRVF